MSSGKAYRSLEVINKIVHVLNANTKANDIFGKLTLRPRLCIN